MTAPLPADPPTTLLYKIVELTKLNFTGADQSIKPRPNDKRWTLLLKWAQTLQTV